MTPNPVEFDGSAEMLLGQAADEFTQELNEGAQPEIEEYVRRYPQIGSVIRQIFPALCSMQAGSTAHLDASASSSAEAVVTGRLGDYQIIREIGRGGMGVVYEADQISLGRRVALKVLPFAAVLARRQLERFQREAQTAAQLHHSNIVPVFSVGCERGVHYYAMQYIDGRPLSAVIAELRSRASASVPAPGGSSEAAIGRDLEHDSDGWSALMSQCVGPAAARPDAQGACGRRGPSGSSGNSTNTPAFFRAVAQLGVRAADALHYAHEQGVIHRDIKPANLLLDSSGHLWVTDFGLARVLSDASLTMTGDMLGTLRYMSPEQILSKRGVVDQRADVYSLGITLYELLSLCPAHAGSSRAELLRCIASEEPRPLRRVNVSIPRELETIIGKAISKEIPDRYASAQELADDLRRFLTDRPVLAKPPTVLERAAKWMRRHRTTVAAGLVVLVLSVIGLSVSTVLIAIERAEAVEQRDAANESQMLAESSMRLARDAMDRLLTHVASAELGGAQLGERVREAFLEGALNAYQPSLTEKTSDLVARRDVGNAYIRVGHINALLGRVAAAETAYREAIRVFAALVASTPQSEEHRAALAGGHAALATLCWERRRYHEAEQPAREAVRIVRQLGSEHVDGGEYRRTLGRGLNLLGIVLRDAGHTDEAANVLHECVALWRDLANGSPETPQYRRELALSLRNLAELLRQSEGEAAAEVIVREAISIQRNLVTEFPDEVVYGAELTHTLRWWAETNLPDGAATPADTQVRPESPLLSSLVSELTAVPWYRQQLAQRYDHLASALTMAGQHKHAAAAYRQAADLQAQLARSFPDVPEYRRELAELYLRQARSMQSTWQLGKSREASRRAIEVLTQLVTEFPDDVDSRRQLSKATQEFEYVHDEASIAKLIALSRKSADGVAEAVAVARATDTVHAPMTPFARLVYAEHLMLGGDFERAARTIQQAIDDGGGKTVSRTCFYKSLGWALLGCKRPDEAQAAFREAAAHMEHLTLEALRNECPDPWTAAYFLDAVSEEQYTQRWEQGRSCGSHLGPFPWFYVGMRAELEGRLGDATTAFARCIELGGHPNAHFTANWGAYRLQQLQKATSTGGDAHRPGRCDRE